MRPRLSYSNVLATLAMFIALGGASYAALKLPKNSVGTKQLKRNAVTSAKVRNGSLEATDFGPGQLPAGEDGKQGPQGKPGPEGKQGPPGPTGPTEGFAGAKLSGGEPPEPPVVQITSQTVTLNAAGRLFAFARGELSVNCSTTTSVRVGIYVDGVPAEGSGYALASGTSKELSLWGISQAVSAGEHTISLSVKCTSGTFVASSFGGDGALGAILVGS